MKYVTEIFVGFNIRFRMYLERFRLSGVRVRGFNLKNSNMRVDGNSRGADWVKGGMFTNNKYHIWI